MSTATVAPPRPLSNARCTAEERDEYLARIHALGLTQNGAARGIRRNPGHFSRWLRGDMLSRPVRRELDALLARLENRAKGKRSNGRASAGASRG